MVIINGGGGGDGDGDKFAKVGVREAFFGDGGRRNERRISGSVVVGGEDQWLRGPHQGLWETWGEVYSVGDKCGGEKGSWRK